MTLQELITVLENATQSMPGTIGASASLMGVSGWDSMGVVSFVEEIGETWGFEIDGEAVGQCATVIELHGLVQRGLQEAGLAAQG